MVCCVAALAVMAAIGRVSRELLRWTGIGGAELPTSFAPPGRHRPADVVPRAGADR